MEQSENFLLNSLLKRTQSLTLEEKLRQISPERRSASPYNSELDEIIAFYTTVLELERSKEPDIATDYPYSLHFKDDDKGVILIDLPCNLDFTKSFLNNRKLTNKYQKDLYVGLPVTSKDNPKQIVLFSLTVEHNDLEGYSPQKNLLPIRLSNFSLDSRYVDELDLSENKIKEIEGELAKVKNINDLQKLVKSQLGDDYDLKMELRLGLSSKNIALSQIFSELRRLKSYMVERNELLKDFLTHSAFENQIEKTTEEELISVSPLDDCQKSVVAHALSNKFTVVTGAPGTGKTAVILNIIANALMKDKSVIVASKNNKAVDNVKERFDKIDPSQYLLRFGKKEDVKSKTIPALSKILNRLNMIKYQQVSSSDLLSQYRNAIFEIKDAQKKLSRIEKIKVLKPKLNSEMTDVKSKIEEENQRFSLNSVKIENAYSDISELDNVSSESIKQIVKLRNSFQRKYTGLSEIWYNFFFKKKHADIYLGYVEDLPSSVKMELKIRNLVRSVNDFKDGNDIIDNSNQVISLLERVNDRYQALGKEKARHSSQISNLSSRFDAAKSEYNAISMELEELTAKRTELISSIERSKKSFANIGPQLVAAKIVEIENGQNVSQKISSYKSFIPDNIPWKNEDLPSFIRRSKEFLSVCRLASVTSLSVKAGFPLTDNLFDILVVDEASQCDVASVIPLILRAKHVVVIGDPMQLKHITSVNVQEENKIRDYLGLSSRPYLKYVEQSLWDYAVDFLAQAKQNNSPITLENHYRCHHDIIGYSNHQFYERFLDKPLNIKTDESKMKLSRKGVVMINVHGKQDSENVNINRAEAEEVVSIVKKICSIDEEVSIGVVTPFRAQADHVKYLLGESINERVEVNTAHGFQGDEKDVIIYSLVVTDNSPLRKFNWIDYIAPNLVNVAVTRARQTLYVVGNADYIKAVSPEQNALGYLVRYALSKTK